MFPVGNEPEHCLTCTSAYGVSDQNGRKRVPPHASLELAITVTILAVGARAGTAQRCCVSVPKHAAPLPVPAHACSAPAATHPGSRERGGSFPGPQPARLPPPTPPQAP